MTDMRKDISKAVTKVETAGLKEDIIQWADEWSEKVPFLKKLKGKNRKKEIDAAVEKADA